MLPYSARAREGAPVAVPIAWGELRARLDQADGDWLLYAVQGGDESEATALPLWSSLGAVSAHHAVEVDDDPFFLNAGPRAARTVISATAAALAS